VSDASLSTDNVTLTIKLAAVNASEKVDDLWESTDTVTLTKGAIKDVCGRENEATTIFATQAKAPKIAGVCSSRTADGSWIVQVTECETWNIDNEVLTLVTAPAVMGGNSTATSITVTKASADAIKISCGGFTEHDTISAAAVQLPEGLLVGTGGGKSDLKVLSLDRAAEFTVMDGSGSGPINGSHVVNSSTTSKMEIHVFIQPKNNDIGTCYIAIDKNASSANVDQNAWDGSTRITSAGNANLYVAVPEDLTGWYVHAKIVDDVGNEVCYTASSVTLPNTGSSALLTGWTKG
jgi:hypothetical protein